ncbi:PadR family transcriptional regulator [Bacillus cereus]|uniref:PadR family transcriptional regulator n=1 Tax=Bacillus thuringiensis TaxID=1428 RepID=A0A9X7JAG5_BACTU|nr:PadR family transcriptional regulator [Bacillus thuringiensis]KAB2423145.1 PadR family transcriptional regulator [Bacillus cereus]MBG0967957.1 PadR family transcriptional regulator [Bacillus sp. SRB3LM]KAB2458710.1 PadR family transcriptional regulator [Bacillus cereus]KAB5647172.1 PadR family transcriptional regulator [Bacillus thuringiensis]
MSIDRYIKKIVDILQVTIDIFEKSLIYCKE